MKITQTSSLINWDNRSWWHETQTSSLQLHSITGQMKKMNNTLSNLKCQSHSHSLFHSFIISQRLSFSCFVPPTTPSFTLSFSENFFFITWICFLLIINFYDLLEHFYLINWFLFFMVLCFSSLYYHPGWEFFYCFLCTLVLMIWTSSLKIIIIIRSKNYYSIVKR